VFFASVPPGTRPTSEMNCPISGFYRVWPDGGNREEVWFYEMDQQAIPCFLGRIHV
jgi:hypothetical protein